VLKIQYKLNPKLNVLLHVKDEKNMNENIKFVYAMIFFISLFFVLKDVIAGKSFLLTYFVKNNNKK
jgi:hypothetical protein